MKQTTPAPATRPEPGRSEIKILISGPVAAGKTTAVSSICDNDFVATEASNTNRVVDAKDTTTVAMDYGLCNRFPEYKIHLYGTPGQQRFDFMWDILGKGMDGIVILVNNDQSAPHRVLSDFLRAFPAIPTIVGVTKMDRAPKPSIGAYRTLLKSLVDTPIPVLNVDARIQRDVEQLIGQLLQLMDTPAS